MRKYWESMQNTKINSYIGFAVKMKKAIYGVDNIKRSKLKIYALIYDGTLSENSYKQLKLYGERNDIPIIKSEDELSEILKRDKVKALGIANESLAKAIQEESEVLK